MKNRIVVKEKVQITIEHLYFFSYPPLYTFEIIFDIIGTVTRTNSKNKTGSEPSDIRYFRELFNPEKSVL